MFSKESFFSNISVLMRKYWHACLQLKQIESFVSSEYFILMMITNFNFDYETCLQFCLKTSVQIL